VYVVAWCTSCVSRVVAAGRGPTSDVVDRGEIERCGADDGSRVRLVACVVPASRARRRVWRDPDRSAQGGVSEVLLKYSSVDLRDEKRPPQCRTLLLASRISLYDFACECDAARFVRYALALACVCVVRGCVMCVRSGRVRPVLRRAGACRIGVRGVRWCDREG
jgi:hypothetical protein